MKTALIDFPKCGSMQCPVCLAVKACDRRVIIKIDLDEPAVIVRNLCNGCGDCLSACPYEAIMIIDE